MVSFNMYLKLCLLRGAKYTSREWKFKAASFITAVEEIVSEMERLENEDAKLVTTLF